MSTTVAGVLMNKSHLLHDRVALNLWLIGYSTASFYRVTGCLENLEISGSCLTADTDLVRENCPLLGSRLLPSVL